MVDFTGTAELPTARRLAGRLGYHGMWISIRPNMNLKSLLLVGLVGAGLMGVAEQATPRTRLHASTITSSMVGIQRPRAIRLEVQRELRCSAAG